MKLIYRALGMFAAVNEAMTRQSVNFIPISIIFTLISFGVGVYGLVLLDEGLKEGMEPSPASLTDLMYTENEDPHWVKVAGVTVPGAMFEEFHIDSSTGIKRSVRAYVPLVDPESKQGIFVKMNPKNYNEEEPSYKEVTGMIESMDSTLETELSKTEGIIMGEVLMNRHSVLNLGAKPGSPIAGGLMAFISFPIFFGFFITWIKRYTIFVKSGDGSVSRNSSTTFQGSGDEEEEKIYFVTGFFTFLNGSESRYFVGVPSILTRLETGQMMFASRVNASSHFMGIKMKDREGLWGIVLPRGSVQKKTKGIQYYGTKSMPALRIQFTAHAQMNLRRIIVGFPDESERDQMVHTLN